MRTPPNLVQDYNLPEWCPSRKLWRAWKAYNGPFRSQILSTLTALQHSGAMAQIGDAPKKVDRIIQDEIAGMVGRTRPTITKRISMIASPDPHWTDYCDLRDKEIHLLRPEQHSTDGEARRRRQSETMKDLVKGHPHWSRGRERESKKDRRIRRHIACFITRNKAFASANSYAVAMPADKLPQIAQRNDPAYEAGILADQFGQMFNPNAYRELDVPTNGYDMSVGFNWHENLPLLVKCSCRMGQGKFDFQNVCPRCGDKGFVQAGAMPDIGRLFYQALIDLGLKKRISRCGDCNRVWDQRRSNCPDCGAPGKVVKKEGELDGWTQPAIGKLIGCDVSTVRKYEHAYSYLGLIRTVNGRAYRRCEKCKLEFGMKEKCSRCGDPGKVDRHAHKYIDLTDRTIYEEMAKAEKERINAIVRLHRRWLEKRQQQSLEQAAELAITVLGEWTGKEHKLESFFREMRRRMANRELARFRNVLFPMHRE